MLGNFATSNPNPLQALRFERPGARVIWDVENVNKPTDDRCAVSGQSVVVGGDPSIFFGLDCEEIDRGVVREGALNKIDTSTWNETQHWEGQWQWHFAD